MTSPVRTLTQRIVAAHDAADQRAGLRLAWDLIERFPEARAQGTLWACRFRALAGDAPEALAVLTAGSDAGLWWAPGMLETEPDLAPVRALPGFEGILSASATRWSQAHEDASPDVVARAPDGAGPFPLLVVLHLDAGSADAWLSAADHGVAAALVRSSALSSSDPGSRTWAEPMRTEADVEEALRRASSLVPYDDRVAFAGSGESGRAAAQLALRGRPVAPVGFASLAPIAFDATAEPLRAAASRGIRAWVGAGPPAPDGRATSSLVAALEGAGVEVALEHVGAADADAETPAELPMLLPGALAFLFQG